MGIELLVVRTDLKNRIGSSIFAYKHRVFSRLPLIGFKTGSSTDTLTILFPFHSLTLMFKLATIQYPVYSVSGKVYAAHP